MKKEYVEYLTPEELVEMLERLTGNRISDNISINRQKAVKVAVDGKGARYDVYVEDDDRTMYDTEMQQSENKSILPKRSAPQQEMESGVYENICP